MRTRSAAATAFLIAGLCATAPAVLAQGLTPKPAAAGASLAVGAPGGGDVARDTSVATARMLLRAAVLGAPARAPRAEAGVRPVHRALFCRLDDALDRNRVPLRVRLGSLEAVNKLEGKPGW